ncbi:hypothetical protein N431DRAFT_427108 [Stipitochalara longipes BDJ]|nr:hypothetical protein N431DRAFT_427108 [Stipitochalara longipes BDJ]
MECRSTSPNSSQLYQPYNDNSTKSYQGSTVSAPFLSETDEERKSMKLAASKSTQTDNALPTVFETHLEEICANYSTELVGNSSSSNTWCPVFEDYMFNGDPIPDYLSKLPLEVSDFSSHVDSLDTALFPEYVIPDTNNFQSAPSSSPSSLPSSEPIEDQQWNLNFWLNSSDQVWTPSSLRELSPAPITPSTGQLQSQRRSRAPHTKSAKLETRYPCRKCKKYSGENGFKRKDHLVQHLRYYHDLSSEDLVPRFCRHKNCSRAEGPMNGNRAFITLRDYTKHLREAHEESLFNCSVPGCRRFGANGYSGWGNLLRHVRKNHPRDVSRVIANHDYPLDCLLEI